MNRPSKSQTHLYNREPISPVVGDADSSDSLVKIARRINPGARVLDVGCSVGMLGRYLTQDRECIVDGIDSNADALEIAKPYYNSVGQVNLDDVDLFQLQYPAKYDYIVFADVLEHLRSPELALAQSKKLLAPEGRVLISIPNVSYVGLIAELLDGEFKYRDEGLLDRTHIRFFTASSIRELIESVDMDAFPVDTVELALQESEFNNVIPNHLSTSELETLNLAKDGGVYQFIFEARLLDAQSGRKSDNLMTLQRGSNLKFKPAVYWASDSEGFSEAHRAHCEVSMDGEPHLIRLTIGPGPIRVIRFDPSDIEGTVLLYELTLLNADGDVVWAWTHSDYTIAQTPSLNIDIQMPTSMLEPSVIRCNSKDAHLILPIAPDRATLCTELRARLSWIPSGAKSRNTQDQTFITDDEEGQSAQTPRSLTPICDPIPPHMPIEAERLVGDMGLKLSNELTRVSTQFQIALQENLRLAQELVDLRESDSWKLTSPIRKVSTWSKRLVVEVLTYKYLPSPIVRFACKIPSVSRLVTHRNLSGSTTVMPPLSDYEQSYQDRLGLYEDLSQKDIEAIQVQIRTWERLPSITILMPVYRPNLEYLTLAIESIQQQLYPNWTLSICDDGSQSPELSAFLATFAARDPRIRISTRETNGGIAAATNDALAASDGDHVALMDQDDLLAPEALYWVAYELQNDPDLVLIYSDEDKIDESGNRFDPYFKPDFNTLLLLGQNYCSHLTVVNAKALTQIGGFRSEFVGSQDWDMLLRLTDTLDRKKVKHIPWVLYHWRATDSSTAKTLTSKPYAIDAGLRAVQEALVRRGIDAGAELIPGTGYVRPIFESRDHGSVSILIPTRDKVDLVRNCVESLKSVTYPSFEIVIVDNQSTDPAAVSYLNDLESQGFRVLRYDKPFNYAALHNWAVPQLDCRFICLMNNDVEAISADWLTQMVQLANRDEVGAVGAQLLYSDHTIQHAGVHLGTGGVAGHPYKHVPYESGGYFGRSFLVQEYSAVTAACMLVRKEVWERAGGMDESLRVAFNDVDFCLKLLKLGFSNVYSPRSLLFHHESKSRGSDFDGSRLREFATENAYMKWKWHELLSNDQFANPNLDRRQERVRVARQSGVKLPWTQQPGLIQSPVGIEMGSSGNITLLSGTHITSTVYLPRQVIGKVRHLGIAISNNTHLPRFVNATISNANGHELELTYLGVRNTSLNDPAWLFFELTTGDLSATGLEALIVRLFLPLSESQVDLTTAYSGDWSGHIVGWPERSLITIFHVT